MLNDNDGDVKIFGKKHEERDDELFFIEEMNRQRTNGNAQRAKDLGKMLAELFIVSDIDELPALTDYVSDKEFLYHIKELKTFAVLETLKQGLHNRFLWETAINAFYDKLIKRLPDFYERVSAGTAFSFYRIDAKNKEDACEKIGKSFAMLCGDEKDNTLVQIGAGVFKEACKKIINLIEDLEFVE